MVQLIAALVSTYLPEKDEGQGLVEYALILLLVALALILALRALAVDIGELIGRVGTALDGAK